MLANIVYPNVGILDSVRLLDLKIKNNHSEKWCRIITLYNLEQILCQSYMITWIQRDGCVLYM